MCLLNILKRGVLRIEVELGLVIISKLKKENKQTNKQTIFYYFSYESQCSHYVLVTHVIFETEVNSGRIFTEPLRLTRIMLPRCQGVQLFY